MTEKTWEMVATTVVGVGVALWFAWHKGTQTTVVQQPIQRQPSQWGPSDPSSVQPVQSVQPTMQSVNYVLNDGWHYIPNSFNIDTLGGDTFKIVTNPINLLWKPTPADLVPLNVNNITQTVDTFPITNIVDQFPINLSPVMASPAIFNVNNGTPQCGCGCPTTDFTTLDQIAANLQADYEKTLAAILGMPQIQPTSSIHVNIIEPAQPTRAPPPLKVAAANIWAAGSDMPGAKINVYSP